MNTREHFSNQKHLSWISFQGSRVSWRSPRTSRRTGRRTVFGDLILLFVVLQYFCISDAFLHFAGLWKLSLQQQWRQPPRVDFLQAGGDRWWWWCTVMVMVGDGELMVIYGDGDDDSCNQVYREHRLLSLSSEGLLEVAAFKVFWKKKNFSKTFSSKYNTSPASFCLCLLCSTIPWWCLNCKLWTDLFDL